MTESTTLLGLKTKTQHVSPAESASWVADALTGRDRDRDGCGRRTTNTHWHPTTSGSCVRPPCSSPASYPGGGFLFTLRPQASSLKHHGLNCWSCATFPLASPSVSDCSTIMIYQAYNPISGLSGHLVPVREIN